MSKLGEALVKSLTDALAYAKGEPSGGRVQTVEIPDVRSIRRAPHAPQQEFADAYRLPLPTLKSWEQDRRHADAPASVYRLAIHTW